MAGKKIDLWQVLCKEAKNLRPGLEMGCWEGGYWYDGKTKPGMFTDFAKWGYKFKWVHLQFFSTLNEDGSLTAPGFQDSRHQGEASVDYPALLYRIKRVHNAGYKAAVAVFFHNFETLKPIALFKFFQRLSADLKKEKVPQIIFFPCWEVQGCWPAWPEGATRDCFISPDEFNRQMELIRRTRDAAKAKNILLGIAMSHDIDNRNFNYLSAPGWDYLPGMGVCDWIGLDYYPIKSRGPAWYFNDAKQWYAAIAHKWGKKPFGIFEYSYETNDYSRWPKICPVKWTDEEVAHFVRESFKLAKENKFIKQFHWWFLGKADRVPYSGKK